MGFRECFFCENLLVMVLPVCSIVANSHVSSQAFEAMLPLYSYAPSPCPDLWMRLCDTRYCVCVCMMSAA